MFIISFFFVHDDLFRFVRMFLVQHKVNSVNFSSFQMFICYCQHFWMSRTKSHIIQHIKIILFNNNNIGVSNNLVSKQSGNVHQYKKKKYDCLVLVINGFICILLKFATSKFEKNTNLKFSSRLMTIGIASLSTLITSICRHFTWQI